MGAGLDIVAHFKRVFAFASGWEALRWVDWMMGIDLVALDSSQVCWSLKAGCFSWFLQRRDGSSSPTRRVSIACSLPSPLAS